MIIQLLYGDILYCIVLTLLVSFIVYYGIGVYFMDITILEKSFKLNKRDKKKVLNYFSRFGKVDYIDRGDEKVRDVICADVIVYADGGWGGVRACNYLLMKTPRYAIGFSDATYFLNDLVYNYNVPVFYGLNAIDFVDFMSKVNKKYSNVFEYCDKILKSRDKKLRNIVGGNLTVFNFFLMRKVLEGNKKGLISWLTGKKLFLEDGGFNVIKGDGSFLLDVELERMRQILGCELYEVFSGVLFGGVQDDDYSKNDYLSFKEVFRKHFKNMRIKKVRCSHSGNYVNDLVPLGYSF